MLKKVGQAVSWPRLPSEFGIQTVFRFRILSQEQHMMGLLSVVGAVTLVVGVILWVAMLMAGLENLRKYRESQRAAEKESTE